MKKLLLFAFTLFALGLIASEEGDAENAGGFAPGIVWGKTEADKGLDYETDDGEEVLAGTPEEGGGEGMTEAEVEVSGPVAQYIQDVINYEDFGSAGKDSWVELQGLSGLSQARALVELAVGMQSVSRRDEVGKALMEDSDVLVVGERGHLLVELCKASVVGDDLPNEVDEWLKDEDTDLSDLDRNSLLVELYGFMLPALKESFESSHSKAEFDKLNAQLHGVMIDGLVPEEGTVEREFYDKTLEARDRLYEEEIQSMEEAIAAVEAALAAAQKAKENAAWKSSWLNPRSYFASAEGVDGE